MRLALVARYIVEHTAGEQRSNVFNTKLRQTLGLGKVGAVIAVIKKEVADSNYLRLLAASAAAFSTARAPLRMWLIA